VRVAKSSPWVLSLRNTPTEADHSLPSLQIPPDTVRMGFSSIMNPLYAAPRASGIPTGHHDATRFVYFWALPKLS
jgi:hypothetical protein